MADSRSDADLIRASLIAPEEFAVVFERYWEVLFGYFERRLGRDAASDQASEVFRIAFERRDGFDSDNYERCLPWLYGMAANLVLKERCRLVRHVRAVQRFETVAVPADGNHAEGVAGGVDAEATWSRLREALLGLDDSTREMVLLLAWEDLSYRELADAFDVPLGTVRSRIHRARAALRSHLEAETVGDVEVVEKEARNGR